jgi:PQQ-dependent catabolism-associated CXXCW motif protein
VTPPGALAGRRLVRAALLAAACVLGGAPAAASGAVAVPDGYRMSDYKAPVPDRLPGGTAIDTPRAAALLEDGGAVFLDVMPTPPKPVDRETWNPPTRGSLPGAHWLPNVGRGALPEATASYYRSQLRRLTGGDKSRPLVLFCERDCWMSWNAAKRAIEYDYAKVYWYPGGTTAWREADRPIRQVVPEDRIPR